MNEKPSVRVEVTLVADVTDREYAELVSLLRSSQPYEVQLHTTDLVPLRLARGHLVRVTGVAPEVTGEHKASVKPRQLRIPE